MMNLKLTPEMLAAFRRCGKRGGLAGDPKKKSASAKARWAKAKAAQTISPGIKLGE